MSRYDWTPGHCYAGQTPNNTFLGRERYDSRISEQKILPMDKASGISSHSQGSSYNKLMRCRSVALIEHNKREQFKSMKSKDIQFLNNLTAEPQYPAAQCAMGENIYMYHRLLSGAVEMMNRVNSEMRARTAFDLPNATILLLKLECNRFNKMKQEAWDGNSILTPLGKKEYDATFTNLNPSHFIFHLRNKDDHWQLRVFRQNVVGRHKQIVILPKNTVNGSIFGRCTCGADLTDAVPCKHMAAIALSAVIRPQITPMNVLPIWWKRKKWREQFLLDVYAEANITIKSVIEGQFWTSLYDCVPIGQR